MSDLTVFVPSHDLTLKGSQLCAFLYGPFGEIAEQHLAALIGRSPKHALRIVGMLNWMGSPASLDAVKQVLDHKPSDELFKMAISFFMRVGGPRGREIALGVNSAELPESSRSYYQEIRGAIEKTSYEFMLAAAKQADGNAAVLPSDVLEQHLTKMYETFGRDGRPMAVALLTANIPASELARRLLEIRSRMFRRLSNEAIDDVESLNAIIEALLLRKN